MPHQPSDRRLTVRFTGEEYALLEAKAGSRPVSTVLRELVLAEAATKRRAAVREPIKDHLALAQVLALLGQSDIVREFKHAGRQVEDGVLAATGDTHRAIDEAQATLGDIHRLLMRALGVDER